LGLDFSIMKVTSYECNIFCCAVSREDSEWLFCIL
jgi:hypothetical protein